MATDVLLALAWVAAGLLLVAGTAKLRRPDTAGRALRLAGLPGDAGLVRLLGAAELLLGLAALLGVPLSLPLVGIAYAGFTVFAARQRRDPAAHSGGFGTDATPLTRLHVAVDALLAGASLAVGLQAVGGTTTGADAATLGLPALVASSGPSSAAVAVVALGVATWLVRVLLVDLPRLVDRMVQTAPAAEVAG